MQLALAPCPTEGNDALGRWGPAFALSLIQRVVGKICDRTRPIKKGLGMRARKPTAAQNDAMISATVERGQQNMAMLEQAVIKDNNLLPGEWYGGQLHLSPPASPPSGNTKSYTIALLVGGERHVIDVSQVPEK
jgi:hypothetical protein